EKIRYEILDLMGQGTFGQVVKCKTIKTGELVAVKVVKNQPIYSSHGDKEVEILCKLRDSPEHKERFLQLQNSFVFRGHKCAVFELLSISLHKFLQQKPGKPYLAIYDIQRIASNILETLDLLKDMRIIHTDLKPDNILLKSLDNLHNVKLIDYGSAFFETDRKSYCIQTAFYRSPEVILQMEFGCAIDMWSFGCFVAELFIGKPLFPSGNEAMLMHMMVNTLESSPPDHMLYQGKRSSQFFHFQQQQNNSETQTSQVRLRGLESSSHDIPVNCTTLEQAIMGFRSDNDDINSVINDEDRKNLYDFLKNILVFDPVKRFSPREALKHPFIMEIITPTGSSYSDQQIMDNQAKSKSAFNKNSIATNLSKVLSPPKALKSILKNTQSISLSSPIPIIAQQPENTLDSKVAFLFQQSAASRP
ncbi:MAG: kinase-like domain-containing protein, partial [Benjaminiella poitrasii]